MCIGNGAYGTRITLRFMNTSLLAFAVGLIASLGLTVPVRQLALRVGMVDHPGPRKVHVQPMPLLGGLAIYFGVLIALLISMDGPALRQVIGIYLGATARRAGGNSGRSRPTASSDQIIRRHARGGDNSARFGDSRAGV